MAELIDLSQGKKEMTTESSFDQPAEYLIKLTPNMTRSQVAGVMSVIAKSIKYIIVHSLYEGNESLAHPIMQSIIGCGAQADVSLHHLNEPSRIQPPGPPMPFGRA